jgi:hypothetical protein
VIFALGIEVILTLNCSEERIAFIIRVTRIDELGTTLAVISNRSKMQTNTKATADASKKTEFLIEIGRLTGNRLPPSDLI